MALIYQEITRNKVRSLFLFFFFVCFVGVAGFVFGESAESGGGIGGVAAAVVIAVVYGLITYYAGAKLALAVSGAKKVERRDNEELYRLVENLSIAAGIPTPQIYIINDTAPNAFATGRDPHHAAIAVTTGLLQKLEKTELEGVLAHEFSHIGNYDTRFLILTMVLVGVVTIMADLFLRIGFRFRGGNRRGGGQAQLVIMVIALLLAILGPIFASMMQLAISRKREFLADASGALLTRYPEGLASALEKISGDTEPLEVANRGTAPMYFANPLKGRRVMNLFSTHPDPKERIRRLREMAV